MAEKRDILWRFLGDSKSLQKASKGATKQLSGTEKAMSGAKKAAVGLGAALGAREILQFGQDAITAASDFRESMNAIEVATGAAADDIALLGETAATELGLSRIAVNEAAVAFAAFGENIDTDGNISDTFTEFITRATDFSSVMNLEVSDALQKFQSGLAGESEPLRRFGIDMSAASVAAFAYANGIAEAGATLTEAEKVQARYGLLLQQTEKFAGDFANTQGEIANQTRISNAELENAKILLGEELMPLQKEWVDLQRKQLIPALIETANEIKGMSDGLAAAADGSKTAEDRLKSLAGVLETVAKKINPVTVVVDAAAAAMRRFTRAIADTVTAIKNLVRNPIVLPKIQLPSVPKITLPGLGFNHAGGIVPGMKGTSTPIMAQAGEQVTPLGGDGGGGGTHIEINIGVAGDPLQTAQTIADLLTEYEQFNGTRISGVS